MQYLACCLFLLVSVAQAQFPIIDLYVAPSGPNGDGSSLFPFTDIGAAMSSATLQMETNHVVMHFNPGTYTVAYGQEMAFDGSVIYTPDRDFTVVGLNTVGLSPPPVVFDCEGASVTVFQVNKGDTGGIVHFQDVVFTNCGQAVNISAFEITMNNVFFTTNGGNPALLLQVRSSATITTCVFDTNDQLALTINNQGEVLILDSVFKANGAGYTQNFALQVNQGNALSIVACQFEGNGISVSGTFNVFINDSSVMNSPSPGLFANLFTQIWISRSKFLFNENGIWADGYIASRSYKEEKGAKRDHNAVERGGPPPEARIFVSNDTLLWRNTQNGGTDTVCINGGTVELFPILVDICGACLAGTVFDRCFACGGTDECLGCDGVPFSGATVCLNPDMPYLDTGKPGTLITLSNTLMFARMRPTNAFGAPFIPNFDLAVYILTITEVRPDGSVFQQYDFNQLPFFLSDSGIVQVQGHLASQSVYDYYFSTNPAHISITWVYFPNQANLSDHGVPFTLAEKNLKITIQIDDWPWENGNMSVNTLELIIQTQNNDPIVSYSQVSQPLQGNFTLEQIFADTNHVACAFSFLNFAFFDRLASSQLEIIEFSQLVNLSDSQNNFYMIRFPGYFSSVHYDPDFSVVLAGDQNGDGGGGDNLGLIIGLSVGLPVAGLTVLAVIAGGSLLMYLQRKRLIRNLTSVGKSEDSL